MEIALTVFGAVIGVALAYLVPFVIEWSRSKRRKDINGLWFSAWQPVSGESNEFVYQELAIKTTLSGTKVKSIGHVDRYEWEAYIKRVSPGIFVGSWHSTKKASESNGIVELNLTLCGRMMYGYFIVPHHTGKRKTASTVVLAREDELLSEAFNIAKNSLRDRPNELKFSNKQIQRTPKQRR